MGPVAALLIVTSSVYASTRSGFSRFDSLPASAAERVKVKLTSGESMLRFSPSLLFFADGHRPDVDIFREHEDRRFSYSNDYAVKPRVLELSGREVAAMIDSIATVTQLVDGIADSMPSYSFTLLYTPEGRPPKVFEELLSTANARRLLTSIRGALRSSARASAELTEYARENHLPTLAIPREVTSEVSIEFVELPRDSAAWARTFDVRITNRSDSLLAEPVYLLVTGLPANAKVLNEGGWTFQIRKFGTQYAKVPLTRPLQRGDEAEFELRCAMDPRDTFVPVLRLCSGPGDP